MTLKSIIEVDTAVPGIIRVLLNRPEKRNAIDFEMRQALIDVLTKVLADRNNRALVFGGIGDTFSAGGDVPSMVGLSESQARDRMRHIHVLCRLVSSAGIPVISAIQGFGAGAAVGLALLGDYIVVDKSSKFLFPFMKLGLTPDWGTLHTLPSRVGLRVARQILSRGETISGTEAVRIGLADELSEHDDVMATAVACAQQMARLPQDAFARMKLRLNTPQANLSNELQREEDDQVALLLSDDFLEGYCAFQEKRVADFCRPRIGVGAKSND
ncbi:enoyl-CoA hydratase/isomerase family protein [Pseudomonas gingeri]|uniref:enoyl-CoA hydratase/isomerase family protein n=1 Tax=Pseudomonas gingeri TaxID=117681 RepID=UPI0015A01EE8|nr:enoyl-CoA hydratase/isomerase family protein [Pseudomonas gingeri]NWD66919.1 enoyl-CoA hydratase/isomerase family protein [Pseudomonas gingeri]